MKSMSGRRGRTMPGVLPLGPGAIGRSDDTPALPRITPQQDAEARSKAFYMLYTNFEIHQKTIELFQEFPICSYCNERVKAPDHATALLRNRDGKWLLVHDPVCSMRLIMEENQRLAGEAIPAEQAAQILAENGAVDA